jgi:uncharacterized protein
MKITKDTVKYQLVESLKPEQEINKIIVFGSFLESANPNDIDVAVFQDSEEPYLSLAMKYRRLTRKIAKILPIDIIPLKLTNPPNSFLSEIEAGEIIYER